MVTDPSLYKLAGASGILQGRDEDVLRFFRRVLIPLGWKQRRGGLSEVKCPNFGEGIHEAFKPLWVQRPEASDYPYQHVVVLESSLNPEGTNGVRVRVSWMICPECHEILVRVARGFYVPKDQSDDPGADPGAEFNTEEWFAVPKKTAIRPVDDLVPEPFKTDYLEAAG